MIHYKIYQIVKYAVQKDGILNEIIECSNFSSYSTMEDAILAITRFGSDNVDYTVLPIIRLD